ncbi:MAG: hypothetical protein QOJ43_978 [Gaiellaceae bacterium]|jgi:hypothetical protein|nr:hypothetical protein [Gaiellaceae bacterium]
MTNEMQFLRDARPVADGPSPALRAERRRELLAAIAPAARTGWLRRRRLVGVLAAATILFAAVFVASSSRSGGGEAWAASVVRVAAASPRLLVDGAGWKVMRADEFSAEIGEMTFGDGRRELDLHWQPVREQGGTVKDRATSADLDTTATVLGAEARVFRYAGTDDYTALWVSGRHGIELRGRAPDLNAFKALLGSLRQVDVDTWLTAMPASVVRPSSRAAVVRRMLTDIPLPPGFDSAGLEQGDAVSDRYQLGAKVVGAVTCAWMERWVAAKHEGDATAAAAAVDALSTSRNWVVLHEMDDEGAYPEVLWEHVDAIAGDGTIMGGKPLKVEEEFRDAFGCPH